MNEAIAFVGSKGEQRSTTASVDLECFGLRFVADEQTDGGLDGYPVHVRFSEAGPGWRWPPRV